MRASFIFFFCLLALNCQAQQGVGIGVTSPDPSATLHIQPPANNKGMLIPRLTTDQRNLIASPAEGLLVYDTDVNALYHFNGRWQQVGLPQGSIVMWSGNVVPAGWALCDGQAGRPDLRERFIVGAGGDNGTVTGGPYGIGATGGANTVTLTTNEIPSHNHTFDLLTGSAGYHSHGTTLHEGAGGDHYRVRSSGAGDPRQTYQGWTQSQETSGSNALSTLYGPASYGNSHGVDGLADPSSDGDIKPEGAHRHRVNGTTSSVGSTQAHENRPPYYALAFIIKL